MIIRRPSFSVGWGYHIGTDSPFSFSLCLGRRDPKFRRDLCYKLVVGFAFDWPKLIWHNSDWAVNELGYVRGLPVYRRGYPAYAWTGRRWTIYHVSWSRYFWWIVSR